MTDTLTDDQIEDAWNQWCQGSPKVVDDIFRALRAARTRADTAEQSRSGAAAAATRRALDETAQRKRADAAEARVERLEGALRELHDLAAEASEAGLHTDSSWLWQKAGIALNATPPTEAPAPAATDPTGAPIWAEFWTPPGGPVSPDHTPAPAAGGWRDIASAPRDGSFLIANARGEVCPCQSRDGSRIVQNMPGHRDWSWPEPATHWQPLPAPPSTPATGNLDTVLDDVSAAVEKLTVDEALPEIEPTAGAPPLSVIKACAARRDVHVWPVEPGLWRYRVRRDMGRIIALSEERALLTLMPDLDPLATGDAATPPPAASGAADPGQCDFCGGPVNSAGDCLGLVRDGTAPDPLAAARDAVIEAAKAWRDTWSITGPAGEILSKAVSDLIRAEHATLEAREPYHAKP